VAQDRAGEGFVKIGAAGIAIALADLGSGPVDAPRYGRGLGRFQRKAFGAADMIGLR
jgi:hypothetical protein